MESALARKMNYKGESPCFVSIPDDLQPLFKDPIAQNASLASKPKWLLIFVKEQKELDTWISEVGPHLEGDVPLWFAYPKKSSKKYKSEISRDSGWAKIAELKMEPVKQIAIDEDWSALRFRKLEYIKTMTRRDSMRLSK
jgi:hypothetical protein